MPAKQGHDSASIARQRKAVQDEEFRTALRALLMRPLMRATDDDFPGVRRQADALRSWLAREAGWALHVDSAGARLLKRPGDLANAVRGINGYDRRRYVLLCLACAVLERSDPQITLRVLGDKLLEIATDPALATAGFLFTLSTAQERRELVAVCRTLVDLGVLVLVAGEEEGYVSRGGETADALYDVERRLLAGVMAAARGPSTWRAEDAPATVEDRLRSLVGELVVDSEDGRRIAVRHRLARRLLDDPVVYMSTLDADEHAYFVNQRGAMVDRLCNATGLKAELRAEGTALVDDTGMWSDVFMPAEGTEAHVTLLVAEMLADHVRARTNPPVNGRSPACATVAVVEIVARLAEAQKQYGRYWRKAAREPGAVHQLADIAIAQLQRLDLAVRDGEAVRPLPAIARFAIGEADIVEQPDAAHAGSDTRPDPKVQTELELI